MLRQREVPTEARTGKTSTIRPTTLVVDSNPEELAATKEVLRRAGYQVKDATTFQEARQLLAGELPDVLIADVRLGAFNGLYLLLLSRQIGRAHV